MISKNSPNFDQLMQGHFLNAEWSVVATTCTLKVFNLVIKRSKILELTEKSRS